MTIADAANPANKCSATVTRGDAHCDFTPAAAGNLTLQATFTYTTIIVFPNQPIFYGNLSGTSTSQQTVYSPDVTVTVFGSELAGVQPSFSRTVAGPNFLGVTGTLTCTADTTGHSLSSLSPGTYTIDGQTCTGLTPTVGGNTTNAFHLHFVGGTGGFKVYPNTAASYIVTVTGSQVYSGQPTFSYSVDHLPDGDPTAR